MEKTSQKDPDFVTALRGKERRQRFRLLSKIRKWANTNKKSRTCDWTWISLRWSRSSRTPGTKSTTSYCGRKFGWEKIIFDCVRHGDQIFGTEKFRICIVWVTTWAWIPKITVAWSKSMGRSGSTGENKFVWRIKIEEPFSWRKLRKKLPRNWRIEKALLFTKKTQ